jgi:hypothetical protein
VTGPSAAELRSGEDHPPARLHRSDDLVVVISQLRENNEILDAVLESTDDMIWRLDEKPLRPTALARLIGQLLDHR